MNNTKWKEIFLTFYNYECKDNEIKIPWRTKDVNSGFISNWDGSWTHFGCDPAGYHTIEWLKIQLTDHNRDTVLSELSAIHIPAEIVDDEVIVYGYRTDIEYLNYSK